MNDNKKFDLLSDLARLMKKYGPEAFVDLANDLALTGFIGGFAEALKKAAEIGRNTQRTVKERSGHSQQRLDFRSSLVNISLHDPIKGTLLLKLYDGLMSKTLLATLKDMKNFALDNGLPLLKSTSREKAIIPFVKAFIPMAFEDISEYIKRIQPSASQNRGLEDWSDIILGKKNEASNLTPSSAVPLIARWDWKLMPNSTGTRHEYEFTVELYNAGSSMIDKWQVDVWFPSMYVTSPELVHRKTSDIDFPQDGKRIWPNTSLHVLRVPYFVTDANWPEHVDNQPKVKIRVMTENAPPWEKEILMKEIQKF